jgi:glycosyltransferase involved in cell wall biosynthesis
VSTFHGNYSVNAYSAIMTKAERLIAISETARQTIATNYKLPLERLAVVHRGVDDAVFCAHPPPSKWFEALYADHPQLQGKQIILLPGRITRFKGVDHFIRVIGQLRQSHPQAHGVVVGGADPKKAALMAELQGLTAQLDLSEHITFLGNRRDMVELYNWADVVCHLSTRPEPFGRTLTEALACQTPVVTYDHGGPRESLQYCFPQGLVPPGDIAGVAACVAEQLDTQHPIRLHSDFLLTTQVSKTLSIYESLLEDIALRRSD